jgi:hypothetical protein
MKIEKKYKTSLLERRRGDIWRVTVRLVNANFYGVEPVGFVKEIGCSLLDFQWHLERQFDKYMRWTNYGTWHVDHIRPCVTFDPDDVEQAVQCHHWSNLRPILCELNTMRHHTEIKLSRADMHLQTKRYQVFKTITPRETVIIDGNLELQK